MMLGALDGAWCAQWCLVHSMVPVGAASIVGAASTASTNAEAADTLTPTTSQCFVYATSECKLDGELSNWMQTGLDGSPKLTNHLCAFLPYVHFLRINKHR